MMIAELQKNPHLQNPKLTPAEMAMVCDVANPGFKWQREIWGNNPDMLALMIRAEVEDSFRLYPGSYEQKWGIDRQEFIQKLWEMTAEELATVAGQVDQFWQESMVK